MNKRLGKHRIIIGIVAIIIALGGLGGGILLLDRTARAPKTAVRSAARPAPASAPATQPAPAAVTPTPSFDKTRYSTSDPASLWVVVNKQHPYSPIDYTPSDLVSAYGHQVSSRIVGDLTAMVNDAAANGAYLTVASSYRSYQYQVNLYNSYVAADGAAKADTYSARAGFSEHQSGLAIDFGDRAGSCIVEPCYANTAEGAWLAANAYKYGFLLRYTAEKQSVTGYEAEAWHYRYVGRDLTEQMHTTGVSTLEEFFGVSGGETYIGS